MVRSLPSYQFDIATRRVVAFVRMLHDGDVTVDVPYQRQSVWTAEQQVNLVRSFQISLPVPAILLADRGIDEAVAGRPQFAVVDGRQRLEAVLAWHDDQLAIPASWVDPDWVDPDKVTVDGQVTRSGLTKVGDRMWQSRWLLPVNTVTGLTLQEEADLYLLTNFGGVAQTDADAARARTVATSR